MYNNNNNEAAITYTFTYRQNKFICVLFAAFISTYDKSLALKSINKRQQTSRCSINNLPTSNNHKYP